MRLVTAQEMQVIDKKASQEFAIPGILLMDQAAKAVADAVLRPENFVEGGSGRVVVFCGKGNNGGDGFGAARYLLNAGLELEVYLVNATLAQVTGDALLEAEMLQKAGIQIKTIMTEEDLTKAKHSCYKAEVIVDAMLGTGFSGELRGLIKEVCLLINSLDKVVVSVDVPTGVNADLGTRCEAALWADSTVTMALPKTGLLLYPAKENVGELILAAIGMPNRLLEDCPSKKYMLEPELVRQMLPVRRPNAHKGDAGRVVLAAGSPGFIGAAAMSSWSAVKAGAGLVTLLTPQSTQASLAIKLTEVMVQGLPEEKEALSTTAIEEICQWAAKADVLAIGPGLGTSEKTGAIVREVLSQVKVPVVIDADALTALKDHTELLQSMTAPKVLTPHPGEMARLTGLSIKEIDTNRVEIAAKYAKEWQAVVVLKGAPTVIGLPEGEVYLNPTGCNAMATGGSGDVLTGIIAAYLASGMKSEAAALCGVYLHGMAGELASQGEIGLAASEIAVALPKARKHLYNEENLAFSIYNSSLKMVK